MRRDTFERHVRGALTNLYDPVYIQTHPLIECLGLRASLGGSQGEALRDALWDAVEALKPEDTVPLEQPAWFSYRILWLHYIQGMSVEETCNAIGLSPRSFRRYQKRAIEAVAGVLWDRYELAAGKAPLPGIAVEVDSLEEARRFARSSSYRRCRLSDIVRDVLDTIQPLIKELGLDMHFPEIADDAEMHGDPALLAQIVLNVLMGTLPALSGPLLTVTMGLEDGQLVCRLVPLHSARLRKALAESFEMDISRVLLEVYGGQLVPHDQGESSSLVVAIPIPNPDTILAVDDDPDTVGLYRRYLGGFYLVEQARSVEEAAATLQQHKPDVVLLDVLMPHEDGWKFLRALRADPTLAGVAVVVCSVLSQPSLALALGADRVLQKPIGRDALLATIRELLGHPDSSLPPHPASPPTA